MRAQSSSGKKPLSSVYATMRVFSLVPALIFHFRVFFAKIPREKRFAALPLSILTHASPLSHPHASAMAVPASLTTPAVSYVALRVCRFYVASRLSMQAVQRTFCRVGPGGGAAAP